MAIGGHTTVCATPAPGTQCEVRSVFALVASVAWWRRPSGNLVMLEGVALGPAADWPSLNLIARPPLEQQYAPPAEGSEDDEDDEQYRQLCPACDTTLCINTAVMIYENPQWGERTFCSDCYWDHKLYKDDTWSDNVDEIVDHLTGLGLDEAQIRTIAPIVAAAHSAGQSPSTASSET